MESQRQFLASAAKASGAALVSLIGQVLQQPDIFVFGEFLALDSVKAVACVVRAALQRVCGGRLYIYMSLLRVGRWRFAAGQAAQARTRF